MEYQEPIIINFPDGGTATVYRPILTEEERKRRMAEIERCAAELIVSARKAARQRELKEMQDGISKC